MPPGGGLAPADIDAIDDWINSGAVGIDIDQCNTSSVPDVAPDEALAFLTAANAVDGIWESVMGYRLTIDHGFPRNKEQRDMLWNLTEYTFLAEDWSLKAVLTKVLASDWFARRAPSLSQLDSAYPLEAILNPWIAENPLDNPNPTAIQEHNGKGEQVNRYRVNTLLRSIADALGWEEPRRFRDFSYPTTVDEALGQYRSPTIAGFDDVNFQSLLALEAEVGLCDKTGKAVGSDDWIDLLVDAITQFNTDNPDTPITIGDAYSILKDRMIQDTTIQSELPQELDGIADALTEELAVVELFETGTGSPLTMSSSASDLSEAELDDKLRESCGALVKTPQFLLANITPRGYSDNNMPDAPRLNVCLDDQDCSYAEACGYWRSTLWGMGNYIACEDRTVRRAQLIFLPFPGDFTITPIEPGPFTPIWENRLVWPMQDVTPVDIERDRKLTPEPVLKQAEFDLAFQLRSATICPRGMGGFVRKPSVTHCLNKPNAESCRRLVASCDPRDSAGINHCGRPANDVRAEGVHVLWADGAVVQEAEGVTFMRPTVKQQPAGRGAADLRRNDRRLLDINRNVAAPVAATRVRPTLIDPQAGKGVGSRLSKIELTRLQKKPVGPLSGRDLRWKRLKKGERLRAGDLVNIPLSGTLTIKHKGSVLTTGKPIKASYDGRAQGHVLSITGPSAERLLAEPTKRGALSVAQLREGFLSGEFDSKAPTKQQWERLKRLSVKPQSMYEPDLKERYKKAAAFDDQHILDDPRYTPEGNDRPKQEDSR